MFVANHHLGKFGKEARRPGSPLQWYGGKHSLSRRIVKILPEHDCYCEPMLGGGSLFFTKHPAKVEILNDLDGDLMNFYEHLKDASKRKCLIAALRAVPYSRQAFRRAGQITTDPLKRAVNFYIRNRQAFNGRGRETWSYSKKSNKANGWRNVLNRLKVAGDRLECVQLECLDCVVVMQKYDGAGTLHFVDPPYPAQTRTKNSPGLYAHEFSDDKHIEVLETVKDLAGPVILCSYESDMYSSRLSDWTLATIKVRASGSYHQQRNVKPHRIEALYMNKKAVEHNPNFNSNVFDEIRSL